MFAWLGGGRDVCRGLKCRLGLAGRTARRPRLSSRGEGGGEAVAATPSLGVAGVTLAMKFKFLTKAEYLVAQVEAYPQSILTQVIALHLVFKPTKFLRNQ